MLLPVSNVQFLLSKYSCWFMLNLWVENNIKKKKVENDSFFLRVYSR